MAADESNRGASALLERIKEHINSPVFEVELSSGALIWASDSARVFLSFDEPLERHDISDIINPHDCRSLTRSLEAAVVDGSPVSSIVRAVTPKGERTARVSGEIYFVGGEPRALLTFSEVDFQSEYYEQLQKDNDDLRRLVSNVPCGFFSYDIDAGSSFVGVSAGLLEIFGYTEGEFRRVFNNKYFDMIYEEDRESAKLTVFNQLAKNDRSDLAYRVRRADGSLRWLYEKGHLVVETDGSQVFYVAALDATELYQTREDLRSANLELAAISENVPCALAVFEVGDEVNRLFANDRYFELFGVNRQDGQVRSLLRRSLSYAEFESFRTKSIETAGSRKPFSFECCINSMGGDVRWCDCVCKVFNKTPEGRPIVAMMLSDVTERKRVELELAVQAERARLISEITDEKIFEYDPHTDIMTLPAARGGSEPVVLRSFRVLVNRRDGGGNAEGSCAKAFDFMLSRPDGKTVDFHTDYFSDKDEWYRAVYRSIIGEDGLTARIVGRIYNITREREEQSRLLKKASEDPLTNLLNRSTLRSNIESFLSGEGQGVTHAVIVLDIDDFKQVNDTYGHPFGDSVISDVARALSVTFRTSDYVGRIGGDEFLAFLKKTDREAALKKARELAKLISELAGKEADAKITVSGGVALYPDDAGSYMRLYLKADMALYEAKRAGKNSVTVYEKEMDKNSSYNPPSA